MEFSNPCRHDSKLPMPSKPTAPQGRRWSASLTAILCLLLGQGTSIAAEEVQARRTSPFEAAKSLATAGNYSEAMAALQARLSTTTTADERIAAHELLSEWSMLTDTASQSNASYHIEAALALNPTLGRLHARKAQCMMMTNTTGEDLVQELRRTLSLGFTNADVHYMLGSVFKSRGEQAKDDASFRADYTEAFRHYTRAVELETRHFAALGNTADMLFNIGQHEGAAKVYQLVLDMTPPDTLKSFTLTRQAHCHVRMKHFDQAAALLDKAEAALNQLKPPSTEMGAIALRLERVRLLSYKVENWVIANKRESALRTCEEIRQQVAESRKTFDSPQLDQWDDLALDVLENRHPEAWARLAR